MALSIGYHDPVTAIQKAAGLHDGEKLQQMTAQENIDLNERIARKAGIPTEKVAKHEKASREFARRISCP